MPGFDRTGPWGAGPMTGGARGLCNPATAVTIPSSAVRYGFGRGLGFRRGRGGGYGPGMGRGCGIDRGYGWYPPAFYPDYPVDPASEINILKAQAEGMKNSLDEINKRIDTLLEKTTEAL